MNTCNFNNNSTKQNIMEQYEVTFKHVNVSNHQQLAWPNVEAEGDLSYCLTMDQDIPSGMMTKLYAKKKPLYSINSILTDNNSTETVTPMLWNDEEIVTSTSIKSPTNINCNNNNNAINKKISFPRNFTAHISLPNKPYVRSKASIVSSLETIYEESALQLQQPILQNSNQKQYKRTINESAVARKRNKLF